MRFLKSWMLLVFCCANAWAYAQGADTLYTAIDTVVAPAFDTVIHTVPLADDDGMDTLARLEAAAAAAPVHTAKPFPDSLYKSYQKDDAFWYANETLKKNDAAQKGSRFGLWLAKQKWIKDLLWILMVVAFIAVMFLFLQKSNVRLFHRKAKDLKPLPQAALQENIFTIDYTAAIAKAVGEKDYRRAVRLHFLQLLAMMADCGIIRYNEASTNNDYLAQLRPTSYYHNFRQLMRHFEYVCYGAFDVSDTQYRLIEKEYEQLKGGMGF